MPAKKEIIPSKRPGRNHSPAFKAKVVLAAVKGERAITELAQHNWLQKGPVTGDVKKLLHGTEHKAK